MDLSTVATFKWALVFFIWMGANDVADCQSRILVVMPFSSTSHKNLFVPLMLALADRGHHLTFITGKRTEALQNNTNVREIVVEMKVDFTVENKGVKEGQNFFESLVEQPFKTKVEFAKSFQQVPESTIHSTYGDPQVQKMLKEDQFDLVLISMVTHHIGTPFAWHFKCPFILMSPSVIFYDLPFVMGDSEHTEYVPLSISSYTDRMSLMERTINTAMIHFFNLYGKLIYAPIHDRLMQSFLPGCPPVSELEKNVSIVFTNTHPSFIYARANPPGVIEVGALQCRPAKPLPKHFEEFIEGSGDDGFFIFSVGSIIQMNEMPKRIVGMFKQAFARLPQRFIWQWKNPDENFAKQMPSNVLLSGWLPQQDILGHPKCKGFLTHGGLLSTQEAVYHGVPVIGLPFVTDQQHNVIRAVMDGYAVQLSWADIDEEKIYDALQEILKQPSYRDNVKRRQSLLRDQLQTPLDRAVYWTEYAIRHKGAPALRLASRDLNRFQRNMLDVYLVLLSLLALVVMTTYLLLRSCSRQLLRKTI